MSALPVAKPRTIIVNTVADGAICEVATANETIDIGSSNAMAVATVSCRNGSKKSTVSCENWTSNVVTNVSKRTTTNVVNVGGQIINNYY